MRVRTTAHEGVVIQGRRAAISLFNMLLVAIFLALAACSPTSTTQEPTPTNTISPTATSLPIGCPDASMPAILPGATLTLD